jgi:excisionase family DNA binding protein
MISSEDLAVYLDVPVSTLDQWASRGGGPFFHKVGIHRRYEPADVREWLKKGRYAKTGDPRPTGSTGGTEAGEQRPAAGPSPKATRHSAARRDSSPAA